MRSYCNNNYYYNLLFTDLWLTLVVKDLSLRCGISQSDNRELLLRNDAAEFDLQITVQVFEIRHLRRGWSNIICLYFMDEIFCYSIL